MTTPPRLLPLLAQFDFAAEQLANRVQGLTDDEYLWEPAEHAWSVRPAGQERTARRFGGGGWVLEYANDPGEPAPVTTIAWRMVHLASGMTLRADYTVGSRAMTWDDYTIPSTAAGGIEALTNALAAWRGVLAVATDADLDTVGRSAFPWGLDPQLPLLDITWWVNQELLHHGAEIALLRDLYAHGAGRPERA